MGLPVTVYRHTDVGAPVVQPTKPSDWLTIIKACLVDGYGDKDPLGWSLDFVDDINSKMVFRNDESVGGSGGAVQVQFHSGDSVGGHVRFTAANAITAIDEFVEPAGYRTIVTTSNAVYANGWTIIGCGRSFFIRPEGCNSGFFSSTGSNNHSYHKPLWIGDVISAVPNNSHVFTLICATVGITPSSGSTSNTYITNSWGYTGGSSTALLLGCQLYSPDSSGDTANYYCDYRSHNNSPSSYSTDPEVEQIPMILSPVVFNREVYGDKSLPTVGCQMAGVYYSRFYGLYGSAVPITRDLGDESFDYVYGYRGSCFWVQVTGEWYD
ncbi:hypothetical protein NVP2096O_33 [Vibrio phage 2.096.O._10N.286.48.B5]|nr:hypothetical protein NVP2096O_33 [Vibrio phage 2.096.O._10N.286.48.B5]